MQNVDAEGALEWIAHRPIFMYWGALENGTLEKCQ